MSSDSVAVALRDEQTAYELQLQEFVDLDEQREGNQPEGQSQISDAEFAVELFRNEMLLGIQFIQDRVIARSHAYAVHSDWRLLSALSLDEVQATEDRRVAEELHVADGGGPIPPPAPALAELVDRRVTEGQDKDQEEDPDEEKDEVKEEDQDEDVTESDSAAPQFQTPSAEHQRQQILNSEPCQVATANCCSCLETFLAQGVVRLRCNDVYCTGCLRTLTLTSMTDMSLFPPRCHRAPIPFHLVEPHLTAQEQDDLRHKAIEYDTENKTYCSNQQCGRFVIEVTEDRADCLKCGQSTCIRCKNKYHVAEDCPEDVEINATLALAAAQGWRRCPSCQRMIELSTGCNHISCRCGHEFCYECGTRWQTCTCALWEEQRLLARADEIVDRDAVAPLPPAVRQARVEEVRRNLRNEVEECEHSRHFKQLNEPPRRGYRCEICRRRLHIFALQCRLCELRVCIDCRRNRLR